MPKLYALFDPKDHRPRYIGISYGDIPSRLKGHLAAARNHARAHRVYEWIRSLTADGRSPQAMEIDHMPTLGRFFAHRVPYPIWERRAIEHWRILYPDLLNGRPGSHPDNRTRLVKERRGKAIDAAAKLLPRGRKPR